MGLLWPMGWKPVSRDGDKLVININDKISKDFAAYWQDLITAGVIETKPGFNNEWYTGLDSGRYATWLTAGWGPVFLTSFAKTSAGQWRAADLPQWDASKFATGTWGGSIAGRDESDPASARGRRSRDLAEHGSRSHKALHHQAILLPLHQRAAVEPGMGGRTSWISTAARR